MIICMAMLNFQASIGLLMQHINLEENMKHCLYGIFILTHTITVVITYYYSLRRELLFRLV